jgi:hypothetical protein
MVSGVSAFWDKRTVGPIKALHPMTGKVITVDPQKDCFIGSDLDMSLRRLPALMSWYLALRDRAEEYKREMMHEEHNTNEDLHEVYRNKFSGKVTETLIKMAVKRDPKMRAAYKNRMAAETMLNQLESAVKALSQKSYSLRGLVDNAVREYHTKDSL